MSRIPSFNVADIKGRIKELNQKRNGGNRNRNYNEDFFPFFLMDVGDEAVVRILPDIDRTNPNIWYIERFNHKLNVDGREYSVVCPTTYERGAECPICAASSGYYKSGDSERGKQHWRGKPIANLQVLVLSHGEIKNRDGQSLDFTNKVCRVSFTWQVLSALLEQIPNFDDDDIPFCGIPEGYNFILKATKNGDNKVWAFSAFERKPSKLTDEQVALVEESLVEYSTLLPPRPSIEKLEHILAAAAGLEDLDFSQFNDNSSDDSDNSSDDSEKSLKAKSARASSPEVAVKEEAPAPEPVKADDPPFELDDEDGDELVAELSDDDDDDEDLITSILGR